MPMGPKATELIMKRKTSLDWLRWVPAPQFKTKANGQPAAVTLNPVTYVALLIRGNVTDPALWPPGSQEGAAWLQRVRAIEKRCLARHGHFDWGKLSRRLQDESDVQCSRLSQLQDTAERIPLRELMRQEGEESECMTRSSC